MRSLVAFALALLIGTAIVTTVVEGVRSEASPQRGVEPTIVSPTVEPGSVTPGSALPPTATGPAGPGAPATSVASGFTLAQVAVHASGTDCWLAISGSVYDVTRYLGEHPGGSRTIVPWCGKEATDAFATEDGRGEHSEAAEALLAEYVLGPLVAA